jgi:nucleoside phosphorylase
MTEYGCDFALLTVVDEARDAAVEFLNVQRQNWIDRLGLKWATAYVPALDGGKHVVVVGKSVDRSNGPAFEAADAMLRAWRPRHFVVADIGGGFVDRDDIQLGDVVVASDIKYFEVEKQVPHGPARPREYPIQQPSTGPRDSFGSLSSWKPDWYRKAGLMRPKSAQRRTPKVLPGQIVCGEKLLTDPDSDLVKRLVVTFDKALAVDMESAGVGRALLARQREGIFCEFTVLRGISDFIDKLDDDNQAVRDNWKPYAARVAVLAAYTWITQAASTSGVIASGVTPLIPAVGRKHDQRKTTAIPRESHSVVSASGPMFPSSPSVGNSSPLGQFVITPSDILLRSRFFKESSGGKAVGSIASLDHLRGSLGVSDGFIDVRETRSWMYPSYITAEINRTTIEGRDGDKVALVGFTQLPIDVNEGRITLAVGPTKYSARVAMQRRRSQVEEDLAHGATHLVKNSHGVDAGQVPVLPMQLHCDGLVITSDDKVLLARRGPAVDIDVLQWAASFGESMDWGQDRNSAGMLHPIETVWRGLEEELGLPKKWVIERGEPSIRFMELGCQLDSLIYILFCIVRLPNIDIAEALHRAANHRTDKEPDAFHYMDFTPEGCATAVVHGTTNGRTLNYSGRFALLLAGLSLLEPQFSREFKRLRGL